MNKQGFTLTELLIVLIVISGLMFLIIPNLTHTKSNIDDKTCDAYMELVNSQIQAYFLEHDAYPTIEDLLSEGYIKSTTCPNSNTRLIIDTESHKVIKDEME
ncbi:MAG TPA: competence type IV pilus major pilin ComGC [Haloplasmataceae bacterium]